tara:strand:+ start:482 stop:781 length:300 start_codon:yes stop_codon:yes gene_type:complete
MINKKNMEKKMVKVKWKKNSIYSFHTKNLREWIADHNAFPLSKKIELPIDKDSAKLIYDQINSTLEDGAYPKHRAWLNKVKQDLETMGFKDHWKGYKYA